MVLLTAIIFFDVVRTNKIASIVFTLILSVRVRVTEAILLSRAEEGVFILNVEEGVFILNVDEGLFILPISSERNAKKTGTSIYILPILLFFINKRLKKLTSQIRLGRSS